MILICHRGNISGPKSSMENRPQYIEAALEKGYECEVDVWYDKDGYHLGHDEPLYKTDKDFLLQHKLWCHAKNVSAFDAMMNDGIHCFWNDNDDVTLTSRGIIWMHSDTKPIKNSIAVMPELSNNEPIPGCKGVCSDYIERYA